MKRNKKILNILLVGIIGVLLSTNVVAKTNIKPNKLKVGDTVQLITPGFQISGEQLQFSKERLEALGLKVIIP